MYVLCPDTALNDLPELCIVVDLFYRQNCPIPLRQRLVRRRHKKIEPTVNDLLSENKTQRPPVKKQLLIVIHWLSNCKLHNSNKISQQFKNNLIVGKDTL